MVVAADTFTFSGISAKILDCHLSATVLDDHGIWDSVAIVSIIHEF